jgi:hypothetical protein
MTVNSGQPLPTGYGAIRESLHLVAARVLGAARYLDVGRMGLEAIPGGFATPEFGGRRLAVVGDELRNGASTMRLTTLGEAADFAGVDLDAPLPPALVRAATPDTSVAVDQAAATVVADWYWAGRSALGSFTNSIGPDDDPSEPQLWPEHFDLALESGPPPGRANFGVSPGDDGIGEPYAYVGPFVLREGTFWNCSFGAALTYGEVLSGADILDFFLEGRSLLA